LREFAIGNFELADCSCGFHLRMALVAAKRIAFKTSAISFAELTFAYGDLKILGIL
jgi:hypothetical protein